MSKKYRPGMYGRVPADVEQHRQCYWVTSGNGDKSWKDAPTGNVCAYAYRLPGDLSQYRVPKRWRYELAAQTEHTQITIPGTQGAADTLEEAQAAADTMLSDFMS